MPSQCAAAWCNNHSMMASARKVKISFCRFPDPIKEPERRLKWISYCERIHEDGGPWTPTAKFVYLCGEHFITGKAFPNLSHPDYNPSVPRPTNSPQNKKTKKLARPQQSLTPEVSASIFNEDNQPSMEHCINMGLNEIASLLRSFCRKTAEMKCLVLMYLLKVEFYNCNDFKAYTTIQMLMEASSYARNTRGNESIVYNMRNIIPSSLHEFGKIFIDQANMERKYQKTEISYPEDKLDDVEDEVNNFVPLFPIKVEVVEDDTTVNYTSADDLATHTLPDETLSEPENYENQSDSDIKHVMTKECKRAPRKSSRPRKYDDYITGEQQKYTEMQYADSSIKEEEVEMDIELKRASDQVFHKETSEAIPVSGLDLLTRALNRSSSTAVHPATLSSPGPVEEPLSPGPEEYYGDSDDSEETDDVLLTIDFLKDLASSEEEGTKTVVMQYEPLNQVDAMTSIANRTQDDCVIYSPARSTVDMTVTGGVRFTPALTKKSETKSDDPCNNQSKNTKSLVPEKSARGVKRKKLLHSGNDNRSNKVSKLLPGIVKCGQCNIKFKKKGQAYLKHMLWHRSNNATDKMEDNQESNVNIRTSDNKQTRRERFKPEEVWLITDKGKPDPYSTFYFVQCMKCEEKFGGDRKLTAYRQHMKEVHDNTTDLVYKCTKCPKICKLPKQIQRHFEIHFDQRYSCNICGKQFYHTDRFSKHRRIHTRAGESYKCTICGKCCTNEMAFEKHMYFHAEPCDHVCVLCGGRYARKQGLDKHMKKCVSKKDEQIKCTLCDKTFSESKAMDLHRLWHLWKFGEEMKNSGTKDDDADESTANDDNQTIPNDNNSKSSVQEPTTSMSSNQEVSNEMSVGLDQIIKTEDMTQSPESVTKSNVTNTGLNNVHDQQQQRTVLKCHLCLKMFKISGGEYVRHLRTHTDEKKKINTIKYDPELVFLIKNEGPEPFLERFVQKCPECGKEFRGKALHEYPRHMTMVHSVTDQSLVHFTCDICDKTQSNVKIARRHYRTHFEPRYSCSICGMGFRDEDSFRNHKRIHTHQNVSHRCLVCNKWFSSVHALRGHEAVHTGAKAWHCDNCGRSYAQEHTLKKHLTHCTPEKPCLACLLCDKTFHNKESLEAHKRWHKESSTTDVPPPTKIYECSYCGKRLSTVGSLKAHEADHRGDKPHKCGYCGRSFSRKDSLTTHYRSCSADSPALACTVCNTKTFKTKKGLEAHQMWHFENDF